MMLAKFLLALAFFCVEFTSLKHLAAMDAASNVTKLSENLVSLKTSMNLLQGKLTGFSGQLGELADALSKTSKTDQVDPENLHGYIPRVPVVNLKDVLTPDKKPGTILKEIKFAKQQKKLEAQKKKLEDEQIKLEAESPSAESRSVELSELLQKNAEKIKALIDELKKLETQKRELAETQKTIKENDKITGAITLDFSDVRYCTQEEIQKIITQHPETIKILNISGCKNIHALDLRGCINLEELWADGCSEMVHLDLLNCVALKTIDVSNCTKLNSLELNENEKNEYERLYVGNTQLHADSSFVSKILEIIKSKRIKGLAFEGFECFTELDLLNNESLDYLSLYQCSNLINLKINENVNLRVLSLDGTKLNKASVENLQPIIAQSTNLEDLNLWDVEYFEELDLQRCKSLEFFWLNKGLTLRKLSLDSKNLEKECAELLQKTLTHTANLQELDLSGVQDFELLDLRKCKSLEKLNLNDVVFSKLYLNSTKLDKESLKKLQIIIAQSTNLQELDLSGIEGLELLDLRLCNQLQSLWLSGCTRLRGILFDDKKTLPLKVVNLSNCSELNKFQSYTGVAASWIPFLGKHLTGTPLEYLIPQLPKDLELLWVQGSSIKELNLQDFYKLKDLNCDNCDQLASVKLAINGSLTKLSLLNSAIKVLHIEKLFKLKSLSLGGSYNLSKVELPENLLLEILNLRKCTKLSDANLQEILARSQKLLTLDLSFSNVGTIDLGNNKALEYLYFEKCEKLATVKNLSECTKLKTLSFKNCSALDAFGGIFSAWSDSTLNSKILPNLPISLKTLDLTGCVKAKKQIVTSRLPHCKIID